MDTSVKKLDNESEEENELDLSLLSEKVRILSQKDCLDFQESSEVKD